AIIGPAFVRGVRRRPSVINALAPAALLPDLRRGAPPARVRNAEAAVARNHLLHAHLEGWQRAILVHGPSADLRQCAPRGSVGLACPVEEDCSNRIMMSMLPTTPSTATGSQHYPATLLSFLV